MYGSGNSFSSSGSVFASQLIELYTSSLGKGAYWVIGIAAFTTMFSTTLTCLDASPRAMSKTVQLLKMPNFMGSYALWLTILVIGTSCIFLFFMADMGLLVKIATILSFMTAPFYAIANFILIKGKNTPEIYRPKPFLKGLSWIVIVFLIGFSLWYLTVL
jgi:Mn2+/Fe2+ NRAMP family transporter